MVAEFDLDGSIRVEDDVDARPEFDQADALAARDAVADFQVEHDAARDQAGDLLENYGAAFAFYGHDVLLVLVGAGGAHGVQEFSTLIAYIADDARDGRAIDVDVEDVQKNADAGALGSPDFDDGYVGDFAVARGDDGAGNVWDLALRITKKPDAEGAQSKTGNGVRPWREPGNHARREQRCRCRRSIRHEPWELS